MKRIISILLSVLMSMGATLIFPAAAQAYYHYEGEKTYTSADGLYEYMIHGGKYAELLYFYAEKSKDLNNPVFEIPSEVDGYPVKYLYNRLYSADSHNEEEMIKSKKIVIPETVTYIGEGVFAGVSNDMDCYGVEAKDIVIPQSVEYIGPNAFEHCPNLKKLTLPDMVASVGSGAFADCNSLTNVTIPDGWQTIPTACFEDCKNLKKVNLPNNSIKIKDYAFYGCKSLKELNTNYAAEFGKYSFGFKDWISDYTGGIIGRAYKPVKGCVINTCYRNNESDYIQYYQIYKYANKHEVNATFNTPSSMKKTMPMYTGAYFKMLIDGQKASDWKSSAPKVVKVSPSGKVVVLKKGKATLTCKLKNGKKFTLKTRADNSPYLVDKNSYPVDTLYLRKNQTQTLTIYYNVLNREISYKNAKCAKVVSTNKSSSTLKVKGVKVGKGTIKLKVNGVTLKLKVEVK